MAKPLLKSRMILEPFAQFNLSSASIRSIALFSTSLYETLIYVGTVSGKLLLLSLHHPNSNSGSNSNTNNHENNSNNANNDNDDKIKFVRHMLISDCAVESIHVFGEIEKVLVVSDGFIHFVDLELVKPVKKIGALKGVSVVARRLRSKGNGGFSKLTVGGGGDASAGSSFLQRLGGGSGGGGGKLNGGGVNDLPIDDNCVFAAAVGKKLILVGLVGRSNENYDSVAGSLVTLREIPCVDLVKDIVWIDDSIVVGGSSGYYLCSCVTGQCGLIFSLPDMSSSPRLKVLKKEYKVLMLVDNVGVIVDSQGQPVGGSLVFNGSPDGIGEIGTSVVALHSGKMELYLKKSGSFVQKIVLAGEGGGQLFIMDDEDRTGKVVVVATRTKVICYLKVPSEEQIKDFLRKKDFKEAISLVEELHDDGEISKETLSFVHAQVGFLLMFDLRFEEAVNHFLLSETMQPSEIFPFIMPDPNRWSLLVPRNRYWGLHPPPAPLESVIDNGLMAIQRAIFLKKAGLETAVDDEFLLNPPNKDDLLDSALKNSIRYLKTSREKDLSSSVREGVDTLLMYLYRALNRVDEMESLASSENWCIVEELETLLNDSGHLRTLAFLCESKGMSSKALAIWRILARNYSSGYWTDPTQLNETHDVGVNIIYGKETAAAEASRILEELSDQDLILQHLGWIADINQVLAVRILTSEKRSHQLPPYEVIAAIDPKKTEILQRYLQWLIEDQDSDDPQFHTSYALLLTKSALETYESESPSRDAEAGTSDQVNGRNSIFQNPVRERLQFFLQSSDLYDPEEVLDLIQESELWLEKAILYRKLGQETLVLQILAVKLEDNDAAEHYCAEIGRPDAYMQLLDIYLNPTDGKKPMFKAAVRLLHNHGEALDPLQVLERLSPNMPLQLASDTILRMLRARLHHHYQGQLLTVIGCP
ncbi:transforming growth factor-beta receptor-associated protein 1 isoform X2 [Cynara cardunculus var. scolymus]|uniref:transforming growth factor-beta receptor-associated protein 1 isoform X2 n=1 Tax=Cynara cardunculus var. scolymus TaxID=59895 RepID=UPI000D62844D|nr:transforming growth factor-beta receptor-associated protein 1 isoform X2 [Cynara cardunculus var. scolymus]